MSAIGDYVHYQWKGYLNHGITKDGPRVDYESGQQYQEIKRQMFTRLQVNTEHFSQIEDFINKIKTSNKSYYQNIREEIAQELSQEFEGKIKSIDFSKGTVETTDKQFIQSIKKIKKAEMEDQNIEAMIKKIDLLEKVLAQRLENSKGELSKKDLQDIQQRAQQIQEGYEQCFETITDTISKRGFKLKPWARKSGKLGDLRKLVNETISLYAQLPPIYTMEGDLWELIISVAKLEALKKAEKTLEGGVQSEISKNLFGSNRVQIKFNLDKFPSYTHDIITDRLKLSVSDDGQDVLINRRSKTDVQLEWGTDIYKISAKNITINNDAYAWVSVVSDSPLLVLLSGLDVDFVNHYLNVATRHKGKSDSAMQNEGKDIKQEMKQAIFYQALTGDNLISKVDATNVLIVNNKTTGEFKIVPMTDVLNKLEGSISAISVTIGRKNLVKYLFDNRWEKTYEARIRQLIMDLHAAKISASFNIGETHIF